MVKILSAVVVAAMLGAAGCMRAAEYCSLVNPAVNAACGVVAPTPAPKETK